MYYNKEIEFIFLLFFYVSKYNIYCMNKHLLQLCGEKMVVFSNI